MRILEDLTPEECAFLLNDDLDDPCRKPVAYRYTLKRTTESPAVWWAGPGFQSGKFRMPQYVVACQEHRLENKEVHRWIREPIDEWISKIERVR